MIWNYQWTFYKEPIDYNVEVTIRNLPVEQEKEAVLRRFLIDSNHSNFRSKSGNPNLELVEETTVSRKKDVTRQESFKE
jgi:hypothetical protein